MKSPLSELPAFDTKPDFTRTDDQVDFQEDAAFKLPFPASDHFSTRWTRC